MVFLYNTAARVQEAADLRAEHLNLGEHPLVRFHGKGENGAPARYGTTPANCSTS